MVPVLESGSGQVPGRGEERELERKAHNTVSLGRSVRISQSFSTLQIPCPA